MINVALKNGGFYTMIRYYIAMGVVTGLVMGEIAAMRSLGSADASGTLVTRRADEKMNEQLQRFAEYCALQEQCHVLSIEPFIPLGEGLRKGCQNAGLWHVKTVDKENQPKNFIIKSGNFNEFESSKLLHSMLSGETRDRIPNHIKFAYPRYMWQIELNESGVWSTGKIYNLSSGDTCAQLPRSGENSELHTLLFMDEAGGIPGNCFVLNLEKYPEACQNMVYKNLAQAANTLLLLGRPDDSQNLDNIMIDPISGVVTYIDFDRFHFNERVDRNWYYTLIDNHPGIFESARISFLNELDETLRPFAEERLFPERTARVQHQFVELCPPDFADVFFVYECMKKVRDVWPQWSDGWYNNSMLSEEYNARELFSNFLAYPSVNIKEFYANKDKESLLRKIKETATEQARLQVKPLIGETVIVPFNELYITEEEMWAIEASFLPAETKALIEKAYIHTVEKPWLYVMWNPERQGSLLSAEQLNEFRDRMPLPEDELTEVAKAYRLFIQECFVKYTNSQHWTAEIKVI
jgi:hypothetical protein